MLLLSLSKGAGGGAAEVVPPNKGRGALECLGGEREVILHGSTRIPTFVRTQPPFLSTSAYFLSLCCRQESAAFSSWQISYTVA